MGLVESNWGGTRIEAWSPRDVLDECGNPPFSQDGNSNSDTVLYNAMIHPLTKMTIKGVLWYQGKRLLGTSIIQLRSRLNRRISVAHHGSD